MFRLFKKKYRPRFLWMHTHEPNKYTIMCDDNWFASVLLNGQMLAETQEKHMTYLVKHLNKITYRIR